MYFLKVLKGFAKKENLDGSTLKSLQFNSKRSTDNLVEFKFNLDSVEVYRAMEYEFQTVKRGLLLRRYLKVRINQKEFEKIYFGTYKVEKNDPMEVFY